MSKSFYKGITLLAAGFALFYLNLYFFGSGLLSGFASIVMVVGIIFCILGFIGSILKHPIKSIILILIVMLVLYPWLRDLYNSYLVNYLIIVGMR